MKQKSFSLAQLNVLLIVVSLIIFSIIFSFLLYFGLGVIQDSWHARQIAELHASVRNRLILLHQQYPKPTAQQMEEAFADFELDPTYLIVADSEGQILFSYRKTDRGVGRSRGLLVGMQEAHRWESVVSSDGEVLFRFNTHLPSFVEVEANALLLASSGQVLLWALAASLVVAAFTAYLVLLPLKRQSSHLAHALQRMAKGERSVSLEKQSVSEFDTIAQASLVLQQTLQHEEQLRNRWAMDIAHDLRTPLTVLKGQLEAVKDGVFSADEKRLDLLLKEIQRLEVLINGLSLLTRLESPEFILQKSEISLAYILETLKQRFETEAQKRGMQIRIPAQDAFILADSQLFSRALDNLLSNAIHYGHCDKPISLYVESDSQQQALRLYIENEGSIDPQFLPFIFDRLSRAENARSEDGSGLGLAIVQAIVNAHGWQITVESNEKTRFCLHFM